MRRTKNIKTVNDGLTQDDIDKAVERRELMFQALASRMGKGKSSSKGIKDDGRHLTIRLKPVPDSPSDQEREGRPVKIKTVFHSVEVKIEDQFGGAVSCEYHIRESVRKITDHLSRHYPKYSRAELEKLAKAEGEDYEEIRTLVADGIAEQIFQMRIGVARFFHDQLPSTLKTVLNDLIVDAELFGIAKYGYTLAHAADFEKDQKQYRELRRKRVDVVIRKGRPKGKTPVSEAEFNQFKEKVFRILAELQQGKRSHTKHAIARKLFPRNSNPVQQIKRVLERYEITLEQIVADFHAHKL